jgi:hypothetical protein
LSFIPNLYVDSLCNILVTMGFKLHTFGLLWSGLTIEAGGNSSSAAERSFTSRW